MYLQIPASIFDLLDTIMVKYRILYESSNFEHNKYDRQMQYEIAEA